MNKDIIEINYVELKNELRKQIKSDCYDQHNQYKDIHCLEIY